MHDEGLQTKRSTDPEDAKGTDVELEREPPTKRRRLRCPQCAWEPKETDVWSCVCFCVWNTFLTGVCPRVAVIGARRSATAAARGRRTSHGTKTEGDEGGKDA
ncbi:MAG: hypothetical protein H6720_21445 [Sandaracinus sp.]|nr:hypothetical protein [Sandaracinus sp.]